MAGKRGVHLGGVRTLEDFRNRCEVDEDTKCWNWLGARAKGRNGNGAPQIFLAPGVVSDGLIGTTGRRAAWLLSGKKAGRVVWGTCKNSLCCNPAHSKTGSIAEHGAWLAEAGVLRGGHRRAIATKIAAAKLVVPAEKIARVLELVESGRTSNEIAADVGLHKATVSKIRNYKHPSQRQAVLIGASVFAWRPAA